MAITPMTEDVENIQKLSTYPNKDDGLTAEELKKRFDAGAVAIKNYLNSQLVPAVQALENSMGMNIGEEETVTSLDDLLALAGNYLLPMLDNTARTVSCRLDTEDFSEAGELRIYKGIDGNGAQVAVATLSTTGGSTLWICGYNEGGQSNPAWIWDEEWTWCNPPMIIGAEYKTAERWQGKPVYTKLVDMGAMPDNRKTVAHDAAASAVLRCAGVMDDGSTLPRYDYYASPDSTRYALINADVENVYITANTSYMNRTAVAQIWYTKN